MSQRVSKTGKMYNSELFIPFREFPTIQGTAEADERFKEIVQRYNSGGVLPTLSLNQESNTPLAGLHTRSIPGLTQADHAPMYNFDRVLRHGIYSWGATDAQITTAFALEEISGHLTSTMAGSVTPLHLILAALAPGSQDSTLVRSMSGAINSLSSEELITEIVPARDGLRMIMAQEVARYLLPGVKITLPAFSAHDMEKAIERFAMLQRPSDLRVKVLQPLGEAYLKAVIQGHGALHGSALLPIIHRNSRTWRDEDREIIIKGARLLYSRFAEPTGMGFAQGRHLENGYTRGERLPMDLLHALPAFDVAVLARFYDLVQEYNEEWALAAIDWNA